jgi:hypothetical protein
MNDGDRILYENRELEKKPTTPRKFVLEKIRESRGTCGSVGDRYYVFTFHAEGEKPFEISVEYRDNMKNNIGVWVDSQLYEPKIY